MKAIGITSLIASTTLLMGCASAQDVSGTMSIPAVAVKDSSWAAPGDPCYFGVDGNSYPDISAGAQVELRNSAGEIVGFSSLGEGGLLLGWSPDGSMIYSVSDEYVEDYCVFSFTIEQVSLTDDIYTVEVASRGEVNFTKEDLLSGVSLSLGN